MEKKIYECGTLRYTLGGLLFAVGMLLFAFFSLCFTTSVVNTLIPLQLKDALGADNKTIAIITGTIGGIFNLSICPMVSFKSDRYRSRWGRRIPFILLTLPMLVTGILLFAFSDVIADFLREHAHLTRFAPATVTIFMIGVAMVIYQFFYMFVGSVIYYIYNDIIPFAYQARVVGAVQVATTVANTVFNIFLLKYSLSHFRLLMILAAVVYTVGVGLSCLLMKEPEYPPIPPNEKKALNGLAGVLTFMKESFSHPFYWYAFLFDSFRCVSGIGTFLIFFYQNMGLSLDSIGKLYGVQGIIGTVLSIAGAAIGTLLIDRWHPVRVYLFGLLLSILEPLAFMKFLFGTPPPLAFWWSCMILGVFLRINGTLFSFSAMPVLMRTYPRSRFGQFCSACAMLRSILVLIFGLVLGALIDLLKYQCGMGDFAYRWIWGWEFFWMGIAICIFALFYRQWLKLGGDSFCAPAPWSESGKEEMPVTPITHPTESLVKHGMFSVGGAVLLHLVLAIVLAILSEVHHGTVQMLVMVGIPISFVPALIFLWIVRGVKKDLNLMREYKDPHNGIPHHGQLFLSSILAAGMSVVGFYQSCSVLNDAALAARFWILESVILCGILLMILLTMRLERGYAVLAQDDDPIKTG